MAERGGGVGGVGWGLVFFLFFFFSQFLNYRKPTEKRGKKNEEITLWRHRKHDCTCTTLAPLFAANFFGTGFNYTNTLNDARWQVLHFDDPLNFHFDAQSEEKHAPPLHRLLSVSVRNMMGLSPNASFRPRR